MTPYFSSFLMPPSDHDTPSLVILLTVENSENGQEQVDDVKVKTDSCRDLFLHMVVSHDKLGINKNVAGEDEGGDARIN